MGYNMRFNGWGKDESYEEIMGWLEKETPESIPVNLSDFRLDLSEGEVIINPSKNERMPLGERAKTSLYDRLGLGSVDRIVSPETLKMIQSDLNTYMEESDDSLILKVRRREVQGVVTDRYKEIPHTDVVQIVRNLDATPIRISHNDYNMRLQAIFDEREFSPLDDQPIKMGIQCHTSDMGAGSLKFDVFTYRVICSNGCIMGKKSVGSFRTIHVNNLKQAETDARREIESVLGTAQAKLNKMINTLIKSKFEAQNVAEFLGRQKIGPKVLAVLAERIATNRTMFDTWNVLTEAGHDDLFSATMQDTLEKAAGELLHVIAA